MTLFWEKRPDRKNDGRTDPILLDPFGYRWGSKELLQTKFLWSQIICRALSSHLKSFVTQLQKGLNSGPVFTVIRPNSLQQPNESVSIFTKETTNKNANSNWDYLSPFKFIIYININTGFFLTNFQPMFQFYTLWKHQKPFGFLMFSRGIEVEHWFEMG